MKMPIEWHEKQLKTYRKYHEELLIAVHYATANAKISERCIYVLEQQSEEAKCQGKDGFDAERFLKKRSGQ